MQETGTLFCGTTIQYRDKTEDTLQKRRALLLALAICRDVFEKEMFHGDQYASFIIRCKKEAVKDLYLKSALYILTDNRNEKETLRNELFEYPYQKPEELFYVLVLMKEEVPEAWERWKNCLNDLLGVKREKNAYMYVSIYEWIIRNCIEQIRTSRGRKLALLKAIIKLPNTFAHEKNRVYELLSQNGYKKEEIFYLNVWMLRYGIGSHSAGCDSITTVRAVENFCIWVCNQEEEYPDEVYQLCKELIQDFNEYPVHIGGQEGIFEAMHCQMQVKNIKVYLLLYELRNIREFNRSWLHIDLRTAKFESLFEKLGQKEFQYYVERTLAGDNFTKEELLIYLERYRRLMGTDYRTVMFQKYDDKYNCIFQKLCDRHLLDPVRLTKSILLEGAIHPDRKEIYERYLGEYVRKADSPQKMRVLSLFSKKYSAAKLKDIFQIPDFWIQTVNIRKGSWRKFEDMNFLKGKLNVGMIRQLFRWVEEAVFREMTESYMEFLLYLLANKENKPITQLGLMKRVYIAHGFSLAINKKSLLDNRFDKVEAWKYGPVIPSVYHSFKQYKAAPIKDKAVVMEWDDATGDMSFPEPKLTDDKAKKIVEMVWKRYHEFSDSEMVTLTHRKGTPWSVCYVPEHNVPIPDEITAMYYEKLVDNIIRAHRNER